MLKWSFVFLLIMALWSPTKAQDSTKVHTIKSTLGYYRALVFDEVRSNLNYAGNGFRMGLAFTREVDRRVSILEVNYNRERLKNPFNSNHVTGQNFLIQYSFLVGLGTDKLKVGGAWKNSYYERDFFNIPGIDGGNSSGEAFSSLNIALNLNKNFGKGRLEYLVTYPIMAYAFGQEYTGTSTGDFFGPVTFVDINSQVDYLIKVKERLDVVCTYLFRFHKIDRANDFMVANHQLLAGFVFKI